jgi:hypothetical protein
MTVDPPRSPPKTPDERLRNLIHNNLPNSTAGQVRQQRPVQQSVAAATRAPTAPSVTIERLSANSNSVAVTAGDGTSTATSWTAYLDFGGGSIIIGDIDTDPAAVFLAADALFSVALTLYVQPTTPSLLTAPATIRAESSISAFPNTPEVTWHGSDKKSGFSIFKFSGTQDWYVPAGTSLYSRAIYVDLWWHDVDVDCPVTVALDVVRLR